MKQLNYIFVLLTGSLLCSTMLQAQTVRYVKPGGSSAEQALQATSWVEACADLQAVVDASSAGDSVFVAEGTYTGAFLLKEGVHVFGGFSASAPEAGMADRKPMQHKTILDGANVQRVLTQTTVFASPTLWDGFVLQHGNARAASSEGAIYNLDQLNELANAGGGALLLANSMLRNCQVISNTAFGRGGGIYAGPGAHVQGCLVENNTAPAAAGVYLAGAGSVLTNCTVVKNKQIRASQPATLPAIGHFYYADGSWSDTFTAGKELVGIICGINASNPYSGLILHTEEASDRTWALGNTAASGFAPAGYVWRQPSIDELAGIYTHKAVLNTRLATATGTGLSDVDYWSTTEVGGNSAWRINFGTGSTQHLTKGGAIRVRAVTGF